MNLWTWGVLLRMVAEEQDVEIALAENQAAFLVEPIVRNGSIDILFCTALTITIG